LEDDSGRAVRVVEKPRQPRSLLKGVGLYLFRPVVFDAIRRTPRTAMRDEYEITDSIQIMIDDGCAVHACRCVQEDVNVTKPGDLLEVNLRALQAHDLERWIAPGAGIENGAVLERCVVGDKARIGAGSSIRRSVIFAGADVPKDAVIEDCIVTDQEVFKV
jgi:dTDP-glucose pyrophosphorylase